MAENIEKVINVKIAGAEKALANLDKVADTATKIRAELAKTGKSLPEKEINRMARDISNADVQAKKLGRSLKDAFRNIGSEATGGVGLAGLLGGFVGGGVATLIDKATTALYEWITAESDAEKASRALEEATVEATASFASEQVQLDANISVLQDTTASTQDRKLALDELQELYPAYFDNLSVEESSQEQIAEAYDLATNSINNKIKAEVFSKLAVEAYTKAETARRNSLKLSNLTDDERNRLNQVYQQSIGSLGTALNLFGITLDVVGENQENLNEQVAQGTTEYEAYVKQLAEIQKLLDEQEEANNKAAKTSSDREKAQADAAKQRREDAQEGVKDLEDAIRRLQEVSQSGSEEEIQAAQDIVKGFGDRAKAAVEAAKAISGLSGKTQETLKTEIVLNQELANENITRINDVINKLEFFGRGQRALTAEQDADARRLLGIFLEDAIEKGETVQSAFTALTKSGFIIVDEQVKKAFGEGSTFKKLLEQILEPSGAVISASKNAIVANQRELDKLKTQTEAAGTDVAEVVKKVDDAILEAETTFIARKQASDKAKLEALAASPGLTAAALELAGETSLDRIKSNLKAQAEAEFDAVFEATNQFVKDATSEKNKLAGFTLIGGSAEEGFVVTAEARKLIPEEVKFLEKIANDANERLKLAKKAYNQSIAELDIDAADQLIKNAAKASRVRIRQDKADQKTLELQFEAELKRLYDLDKEFTDNKRKLGEDFNQDEVDQVNGHANELIEIKKKEVQKELDVETDRYIQLLEASKGNAEQQLVVLQELYNKRTEIIAKGQSDVEKVTTDFGALLTGDSKDPSKKTSQDILNDFIQIAQQLAQAVDNIFQIIINAQQEIIDGILERIGVVDEALAESQSKIDELESDLDGKRSGRREAILRGIALEQERERQLTEEKIRLAQQLDAEETKLRKKQKAAALTQAIINGALAITSLNASIIDPTPVQAFRIAANIALGAVIGTQIALIASQKFAKGGHTGSANGKADETGQVPVGIVHANEYVVPSWMVQSPRYAPIIDSLESIRTRGFADGGFTSPDFNALSNAANPNMNANVMTMVQRSIEASMALSNRPIIANPVEFTNVNRKVARRVNATTIGG